MTDKILLIDALNYIHRANISFGVKHYLCSSFDEGCKHLITSTHCVCSGEWNMIEDKCSKQSNYTTVYNFFRNLRATVEQFAPDKIFFVLEGHPSFRYEIYPEYKANRIIKTASKQEVKDLLFKNVDLIVSLLGHLPITIVKSEHHECDDVIGSLCEDLKSEDLTVITNDTDYIQLLQRGYDNIKVYSPTKKQYMTAPEYPYIASKALCGDKTDNIKSLVGPKKMEKLLSDPEKLQDFMSVEENRANFSINKKLVEFAQVSTDDMIFVDGIKNFDELKSNFYELGFNSLIEDNYWSKFCNTFDSLKI